MLNLDTFSWSLAREPVQIIYIYIYILITNEDRKQFPFNPLFSVFICDSFVFMRTGERDAWDNFIYIYIYIYIYKVNAREYPPGIYVVKMKD